jgi:hypothetical protein
MAHHNKEYVSSLREKMRRLNRPPVHFLLIAVLGLLAYSNTFDSPFQWDERFFLERNPVVKDLSYFVEPSRAKGTEYYGLLRNRYIGLLTFALNHRLHEFDVAGYHIFNFAVHVLNALLVYTLVVLTFRTPHLRGSSLSGSSTGIALFTALIFVSHPIQTEAVTYIYQRLASLVSFFYLCSLIAYIRSRLARGRPSRYGLYAVSLLSAVVAMKTKENAFTLPLTVALYEYLFFSGPARARVIRLVPFILTMTIIPMTLMEAGLPMDGMTGQIGHATRGFDDVSRENYLFTQFRVVVTYLRLLVLPVRQNVYYDYPVYDTFFKPAVLLSFLFFLAVVIFAGYIFYRSRINPGLRPASFGIYWFFITLTVESSIIPIPMLINEYRVYLPSVGVFLAVATGAFLLMRRLRDGRARKAALAALVLMPLALAYAAYERNKVWMTDVSLWEDVVRKSPLKTKGHFNLGLIYLRKGLIDNAEREFGTVLELNPRDLEAGRFLEFTRKLREEQKAGLNDRQ